MNSSQSLQGALAELQEVHADKDTKELIMRRLQLGDFMLRELFSSPGEDPKPSTPQTEYVQEMLEKQCALVSEIAKNLKTAKELRKKSDELKKENFELKTESRALMQELKDKRTTRKETFSKETESLCSELDKVNQKIALTKGIIEGLVIGSGVNWSKDPKLEELVMKIGETDIS